MAASTAASTSLSLKEYLKKYENNNDDQKKKTKKKKKKKARTDNTGVLVVDEDPVWQKPVPIEGDDELNDSADDKPQMDEDIEVKRMKRLEEIRSRRPYNAISDDGSGWISISNSSKPSISGSEVPDLSPQRQRHGHSPLLEPERKPSNFNNESPDLSPPRQRRRRVDTPSPEPEPKPSKLSSEIPDLSPPRSRRRRYDTPSPEPEPKPSDSGNRSPDLSPLRQQRRRVDTPSPEPEPKQLDSASLNRDLSPPRRSHRQMSRPDFKKRSSDLSLPRRVSNHSSKSEASRVSSAADLSPPRKTGNGLSSGKEEQRAGLFSGREIKDDNAKKRKEEWARFSEMDPTVSGRGAAPVYRDKEGKRVSKDEFLKLQRGEEKPKEKKLEWGKGLAQKREAENREHELELEKNKPFARTRDDPELEKMLKEKIRWGDPMAHLVKRKHSEQVLEDLGDNEKMKESGFVIPQTIPSHSWIKRGTDPPVNRYGIRPGRHWDGVDRSTGYEKELFKRQNEKRATEREAYLWSVSDM